MLGTKRDNFVIRPARRWVEIFADKAAWAHLTPERAAEAVTLLAGLPKAERDDDEQAKRLDWLALRLQLSLLAPDPGAERVRRQVQLIASGLLDQSARPRTPRARRPVQRLRRRRSG